MYRVSCLQQVNLILRDPDSVAWQTTLQRCALFCWLRTRSSRRIVSIAKLR